MVKHSRRAPWYIAAGAALLALALFAPVLGSGFVLWDDDANIFNNIHIRSLGPAFFHWALTDIGMSLWQPVVWVSYAVDHAIWGLNPFGYHLTNLLLHGANVFLVVLLAFRLFGTARARDRSASTLSEDGAVLVAAGVAGVLAGIHPLRVESVAWITGRTDLLCTLFALLSIIAYVRYGSSAAGEGTPWRSRFLHRQYLFSLGAFALALASKPLAVMLPVVLLVLDAYPLKRIGSGRALAAAVVEKLPFAALSAATALVTLAVQRTLGTMTSLHDVSLTERLLVAGRAIASYLGKTVLPVHLIPYYAYPQQVTSGSAAYLLPLLLVAAVTFVCLMQIRKRPGYLAAWTAFLILLLPTLGIIKVRAVFMADRYTYLPGIVLFLLLGVVAARSWQAAARSRLPAALRRGTAVAAAAIVVVLAGLSIGQISVWKDSISLWTAVIEQGPYRVPIAFNNRGLAFFGRGEYGRAIADLTTALQLDPEYYLAYYNRGKAFQAAGDPGSALGDYDRAIGLNPRYADTYASRGKLFLDAGRFDRAVADASAALSLDPDQYEARIIRGAAYREMGMTDRALADYDAAIALDPGAASAYVNRGILYKSGGRLDAALRDYDTAIGLDPSNAEAYNNRGVVFKHRGEFDRAIRDFTRAIDLAPSFALAYCNRGMVYRSAGSGGLALSDFSAAISLDLRMGKAYQERGAVYREQGDLAQARRDERQACALGVREACNPAGGN